MESCEDKNRLKVQSGFCISVGILALFGITFVFLMQKSDEGQIVIFAPIFNYFRHHNPDQLPGDAYSGEDTGSRVMLEARNPDDVHTTPDTPLGQIPQHFNEPNFPDPASEAGQLTNSVRILCCITTTKSRNQNGMGVKQTWGNRCNKTIFVSEDESDPTLESIVIPGVEAGSDFSWRRSKVTADHIWTNYGQEYDWFLKADDTTYVIVENLRHFLQNKSSTKPTFFGCQFDTFIHSGAGFVLNRAALRVLVEGMDDKDKCEPSSIGKEDVELLKCLKNLNVDLGDSRDEYGRHRFLPYTPERHLIPEKLRKTLWFWQTLYSPHQEGMESCSDSAISFHHVQPYQMVVFHYFVFHLRPHGLTSETKPEPKATIHVREPAGKTDPMEDPTKDFCDLRTIPRHLCHCTGVPPPRSLKGIPMSTCSNEATGAGPNQKVISYWLAAQDQTGDPKVNFSSKADLEASLEEVKTLYPGWVARVYTDISLTPNHPACDLLCKYPDTLFWCDVNRLPDQSDKSKMPPKTWPLLALGDPTVDTFVIRDLQRALTPRERAAVAEWEALRYPYHVMRDHPQQPVPLSGHLFGARNDLLTHDVAKWMQTILIEAAEHGTANYANADDALLAQYIYEPQKHLVLAHDSFTCHKYQSGLTLSWPTERQGVTYVGAGRGSGVIVDTDCPPGCRPSFGKEWKRC